MKNKSLYLLFITTLICNIGLFGQVTKCRAFPEFLKNMGFIPQKTLFTTSEKHIIGVMAVMSEKPDDPSSEILKTYQHESWKSAGYLSAMSIDKYGNVFVIPTPRITTLFNPYEQQNTIFKISSSTGVMEPFVTIPVTHLPNNKNPFGLLSITYDCNTDNLLVSTVSGSDEKKELGRIYIVNTINKSCEKILDNIDVYGLGIVDNSNTKELYLGSAKNQGLYKLALDKNCRPISKIQKVLDLSGIGKRGDDKIKKIRFINANSVVLNVSPFYYNLSAPSENQASEIKLEQTVNGWKVVYVR